MVNILILTNEFPFGSLEPYMEIEESYYSRFDKVWLASLQVRSEHAKFRRELISDAEVIQVKYRSKFFYFANSITVLADINLYRECVYLFKTHKFSLSRVISLFVFLSRSHHEARVIDRYLKHIDKSNILLYSYRFEYQPYVAMLLRRKWGINNEIITRAHGYDLYEDRRSNHYIPLRKTILNGVDYVFPCSKNGTKYIEKSYGQFSARVKTRYLGTQDYGIHEYLQMNKDDEIYSLVSCSNMVKLKNIEKIIDALAIIGDRVLQNNEHNEGANTKLRITWTHYGDGILMDDIKTRAMEKIGENNSVIQYAFKGNIRNKDLMKAYMKDNYYFFINVSSYEGLPVSIMEAMSFGIPCIATDVGGTREIVNERNGMLLESGAGAEDIANAIEKVIRMDKLQYQNMRKMARLDWNRQFNANRNYRQFIDEMAQEREEN